ncbi:MAG: VOC family protein [Cellulomonadaceae bacterium]
MTLAVGMITVDSTDPGPLATWWAEQLGGEVVEDNDGWFYVVTVPEQPTRAFQKVDEVTPGKNRVHLDLVAPDRAIEVQRLRAAGATQVDEHTMGDFTWTVLADPQGNVFCVSGSH